MDSDLSISPFALGFHCDPCRNSWRISRLGAIYYRASFRNSCGLLRFAIVGATVTAVSVSQKVAVVGNAALVTTNSSSSMNPNTPPGPIQVIDGGLSM